MYIAPIVKIAAAFSVYIHQYADETQMYTAKEGGSKTLVVVLDKRPSFDAQVDRTCKAIQYHARSFPHIRNSLPDILARTVASSIVSRLDYCNSLRVGTAQTDIIRLQRAQNSIARIVTGTSRFDHIQPLLKELHWLPVDCRIKFKVAMLVYKIRQTGRIAYLTDFIHERRSNALPDRQTCIT